MGVKHYFSDEELKEHWHMLPRPQQRWVFARLLDEFYPELYHVVEEQAHLPIIMDTQEDRVRLGYRNGVWLSFAWVAFTEKLQGAYEREWV